MDTLYLGKLERADPLYEVLSSNVCPAVKDPIFHVNSLSHQVFINIQKKRPELRRLVSFLNSMIQSTTGC